jgi:hypothetical protein
MGASEAQSVVVMVLFFDGKYKGRASVEVLRVHISHKDKT